MSWVDVPDPDSLDATWANVWMLFRHTLRCALVGHRFREYWDEFSGGDMHFRRCYRCHRQWDWEGAPPAWLVKHQKRQEDEHHA